MKRTLKKPEPVDSLTEKANLSLNRQVKHAGIALAESLGYNLSAYVERLLEVQLVKAGKLRRPWLDELREEQKRRAS